MPEISSSLFWIAVLQIIAIDIMLGGIEGSTTLMAAIKTIIVADAVMSLDNVIAVAGASRGSMVLVTFCILVSIPIVVWGSKLVLTLMDRFPLVITLGAALLGWIGGGMLLSDPATPPELAQAIPYAGHVVAATGAILLVSLGTLMASRCAPRAAVELSGVALGSRAGGPLS